MFFRKHVHGELCTKLCNTVYEQKADQYRRTSCNIYIFNWNTIRSTSIAVTVLCLCFLILSEMRWLCYLEDSKQEFVLNLGVLLLLSSSCHLLSLPAGWTVHFELFLFASSKMVDKEWSYWLRSSGISNETLRWLTLVHLPGAGHIIHSWQHFHAGQHLFSESFVPTGFQTI